MDVQGISIENRILEDDKPLSKELAHYMQRRYNCGKIAVATDHPLAVMSSVRKQWLRLIRLAQRERARTLDHQRQHELDQVIWRMQNISFTAQDPVYDPVACVSFATVEQFRLFPPMCTTLFITSPIEKIDQYMLTSWMPRNSLVVIYGQE
jgi:hypothetical protein